MYLKFLIISLFVIAPGCDDNNSLDDYTKSQIDSIEFELVVLDEAGNENSIFESGTDITLAIKVTNNSDEDFLWDLGNTCTLMFLEDFYTLYRLNEEDPSAGYTNLGKPYLFPFDACTFVNLPPARLHPGINFLIEIPWSDNNSVSLGTGKYFSEFSHNLRIDNDHTILWNLRVEFQIE